MPLRHSPPTHGDCRAPIENVVRSFTQDELPAPKIILQHSSSEHDVQNLSDEHSNSNSSVSRRFKRKRTNTSEIHLNNFMSEIRGMMSDLKLQQESQMEKIHAAIDEIISQNTDIRASIDFLSAKYDALIEQVDHLKVQNTHQQEYIQSLELKLENMERGVRSTCLEIKNLPVNKTESKSSLIETVTKIGKVLNANILTNDVKDIFRITTRNPDNKTVIVDFVSIIAKDTVMKAYRKYNKDHSKLMTEQIGISGPSKQIYICENLTAKMKRLFYLTRVFASSKQYKYCWTTNGKIFIREKEGSSYHLIKDESDLKKLDTPV
ncbi:unnamed protein product [Chilo suppressalis]|uniref:FP protein C-terminal domain-containing protein n=1 Tax=Chilo suppressalis TaxID=168631 RepID=A0ABN8AZP2_CHISP|nr:unnamed protein product [Chilo suppressalis]